jgi:hypothetical protein
VARTSLRFLGTILAGAVALTESGRDHAAVPERPARSVRGGWAHRPPGDLRAPRAPENTEKT